MLEIRCLLQQNMTRKIYKMQLEHAIDEWITNPVTVTTLSQKYLSDFN